MAAISSSSSTSSSLNDWPELDPGEGPSRTCSAASTRPPSSWRSSTGEGKPSAARRRRFSFSSSRFLCSSACFTVRSPSTYCLLCGFLAFSVPQRHFGHTQSADANMACSGADPDLVSLLAACAASRLLAVAFRLSASLIHRQSTAIFAVRDSEKLTVVDNDCRRGRHTCRGHGRCQS